MAVGQTRSRVLITVAAIEIVAAVIAASVFAVFFYGNTVTQTVTQTTTTTSTPPTTIQHVATACTITGGWGPLYISIQFDSNQTPVSGAIVAATNHPGFCDGEQVTNQTTLVFSTNQTAWYAINTDYDSTSSSFIIGYSGQIFKFTEYKHPGGGLDTCLTLYVPSGRTETTMPYPGPSCS